MRKFLLAILFIVLLFALVYKSPFSAMYNYNKAKALYDAGKYEQALPHFERSLFADEKGILARFFYVLALSKSEPTYSIQEKLYKMANSKINDEASKYAKSQALALKYTLLEGFENNYIFNAVMGSDIVRWNINSFPLRVYIEQADVPPYYYEAIDEAMAVWVNHTNFVRFNPVQSDVEADIVIKFKDIPDDVCKDNICNYTSAYTEPQITKDKMLSKMFLTIYKTNPLGDVYTKRQIYNTAAHEFGHTLGIMGHSDNPSDLMYSLKTDDINFYNYFTLGDYSLSLRDLRTLVLLYRIKPTITNVFNKDYVNLYYAPLIIGSEDSVLQRKLLEYKKYTQQYPTLASGYINLASVYSDMGNFNASIETLHVAKRYVQNPDEEFLVYFNLGVVNYNLQEYEKALEYANQAKAIKNDPAVSGLIEDILKLMK